MKAKKNRNVRAICRAGERKEMKLKRSRASMMTISETRSAILLFLALIADGIIPVDNVLGCRVFYISKIHSRTEEIDWWKHLLARGPAFITCNGQITHLDRLESGVEGF